MIKVIKVSKRYHDVNAVNDISFSIPRGSVFGFLGPNGAGKTTLIRILTGLIVPDKGHVLFDGQKQDELNMRRIGYLPEERGLYKKMKVGEQTVYLACMKGLTRQVAERRLRQWFEKMNISDWWNKRLDSLSKGMQQKIQFIIATIHHPDILILDEPFSGLDPVNQDILGKEIIELNQTGTTIILSTHDMNSVEQFCNQIVLFDKGSVLLSGKVNEIKLARKSFLYEFCFKQNDELFVNQCNQLGATIVSTNKIGTTFCVKAQFRNEQEAESVLIHTLGQIGLISFREILPSMHDIFVESVIRKSDINL
ncbi:MAG: ATP-binding cassette domain-containing protein [Bacteroidales bacterium]|jgi:ABC-2 type transport system ATP-binding protein|nr:ATP-binding cassette domain-containing protein [Bacteroidales bacterium]